MADLPSEADSIEVLKKKLYRRAGADDLHRERSEFSEPFTREGISVPDEVPVVRDMAKKSPVHAFAWKIFLGSLLFFLVTAGVAGYFLLSGSNIFSPENIEISIAGPVATPGGKDLSLQVTIANKNSVRLETVDFVVEYPAGSRATGPGGKELIRTQEFLDVIEPNQVVNKTVKALLFGEENTQKTIRARLEYRIPNSNAIFTKEKSYTLLLTSSPVGLVVELPKEIRTNDEVPVLLTIGSNSAEVVKDVLVVAGYPSGFSFSSATPAPSVRNNIWRLGDITPGQKRTIAIKGTLEGQDDEVKGFRISLGSASEKDPDSIGAPYTSSFKTVAIVRPQLGVDLVMNGESEETVAVSGDKPVRAELNFVNNLPDQIIDPEITVRFSGVVLDKTSVSPEQGGFYQSGENTVFWDKTLSSDFEKLDPAGKGTVEFSFSPLSPSSSDFPRGRNPEIKIEVSVRGVRLAPGREAEKVETKITRTVRIASSAQLATRAIYSQGPFKNTGPLPPKVDQKTSYTIIWSVINPSNDLSGATVEASLPAYMKWAGVVSPADESVTFSGGKVIWNIGALRAGAGVTSSAREVAFQVVFTPSLAQAETSPVIIADAILKGTDDFTKTEIQSVQRGLTTQLTTDPAFKQGDSTVTR